jgi:hypothetical protein
MLTKIMATHETLTKKNFEPNLKKKSIGFLNTSDFGSKCDE